MGYMAAWEQKVALDERVNLEIYAEADPNPGQPVNNDSALVNTIASLSILLSP